MPHRPLDPVAAVRRWRPSPATATAAIAVAGVCYASTAFFARRLTDAGLAPEAVAFHRFLLTALVLGRFVAVAPGKAPATMWGLASGLVMSVSWVGYVRAIDTGSVATAAVVYLTYPAFTVLALWLAFGRPPTGRAVVGAVVVVGAGLVAVGPSLDGLTPWAFAAPVGFGFAIAVLTERLGPLDPVERLAAVAVGAAGGLLPTVVGMPTEAFVPDSWGTAAGVVGIGLVGALVPMLAYAAAAPAVGGARCAVAGAIELPAAYLIGWAAFGEFLTWRHLAAGALILAAVAITPSAGSDLRTTRRRRSVDARAVPLPSS